MKVFITANQDKCGVWVPSTKLSGHFELCGGNPVLIVQEDPYMCLCYAHRDCYWENPFVGRIWVVYDPHTNRKYYRLDEEKRDEPEVQRRCDPRL